MLEADKMTGFVKVRNWWGKQMAVELWPCAEQSVSIIAPWSYFIINLLVAIVLFCQLEVRECGGDVDVELRWLEL